MRSRGEQHQLENKPCLRDLRSELHALRLRVVPWGPGTQAGAHRWESFALDSLILEMPIVVLMAGALAPYRARSIGSICPNSAGDSQRNNDTLL